MASLFQSRRGQGLSINMLIIIAIGIVVLIVSILMYTNFVRKGDKALSSCGLGGTGICKAQNCSDLGTSPAFGSCGPNQYCCTRTAAEQAEFDAKQQAPVATTGNGAQNSQQTPP
jgi:hypothetical protein